MKPKPIKILLLEDNTFDVELTVRELKKAGIPFVYEHVLDENGYLTALKDFNPDIILSDYSLPSYNGMMAFKQISKNKLRPAFIIVTGALSEQMAFDCISEGVDDFVLKSGYQRLSAAIIRAIEKRKIEMQSDKMATDLIKRNKELEQFAYIISHNIRGSVANIQGLFNIWDPKKRSEKEQNYIHQGLKHSIIKLDEIIRDINYILLVKNEINEEKQLVNFSDIVKDVKLSIYTQLRQEDAKLKCDFNEVESTQTIKSYIYSIFYNLISNSLKYKKENTAPIIKISSKFTDDNIELIFQDNGIGIDLEKNKEKVFGLYKRFTERQEGKGMGLFLVKTQVEALGGSIEVKSKPNEGCEFQIKLPINPNF